MTEESPAKQGDAAWKEQRDEVSRRNAAVQRRAEGDRRQRDGAVAAKAREQAEREADQLRDLNARIGKLQTGGR